MPQLVNIKELKSNLDAQWNHRGDKLCVGASSGEIFIGAFEEDVGFWVAQSAGKVHSESVVNVRFDPGSGHVVASASPDGRVKITSCYDQKLDGKFKAAGPFAGV